MSSRSRRRRQPRRTSRAGDVALTLAILLLLALSVARFDRVATRSVEGRVSVNDGDSLTLDGERLRLAGIDAPEYDQICQLDYRDYACGRRARQTLLELVDGRTVTCRGWQRDRYGRLLVRCEAGGRDLGKAMVENGWAVSYGDYRPEEEEARGAGRGLWAGTFTEPREWRMGKLGEDEPPHDWMQRVINFLRQLLPGTA